MVARETDGKKLLPAHNVIQQDVLWPDCDPAGILFYGNYFRWMDNAAYYLFHEAGLNWDVMMGEYGVPGMPLVSCHADFRYPAKFGDTLTIESNITEISTRVVTVSHVFRLLDKIVAEGWEKRVWVQAEPGHPEKLKSFPVPPEIRTALGFPEK